MLELKEITKIYLVIPAVNKVSFVIEPKEILSLKSGDCTEYAVLFASLAFASSDLSEKSITEMGLILTHFISKTSYHILKIGI